MAALDLNIADLQLDLANPRITGAKNQREALQRIIEDQQDKLLVLARSMVDDDGMNPMDRLLVLREGAKGREHTVLEGNRRLAALKILVTPTILDDLIVPSSRRKAFDKLAARFDRSKVEPLACFEVRDRDEGRKWILLRHTGDNGGKGVVQWSPVAKTRFSGQDPGLQALDFVRTHGGLSQEEKGSIDNDMKLSTLDRLLSSTVARQKLGFDVKNGKLVSGLSPEELMKPLRRLILDIASGELQVGKLMTTKLQTKYFDEEFDKASLPKLSTMGTLRGVAPKLALMRLSGYVAWAAPA